MKKLIFAMLLAFSSSLVMAQAPRRDPNNDPHKASSASYKPSSSSSANAQKPGSATAGVNKPGNSDSKSNNYSKPGGNKPPMAGPGGPGGPGGPKPPMDKPGYGNKPPMGGPGGPGGPKPPMNKPGYGPKPPMPPVNVRPVPPKGAPVSYAELESFIRYMNLVSFDSRKLSEAKSFVRGKALSASQIARIAEELSFDSNRLSFAKYAFKYCIDPGDYYIVEGKLDFLSSKRELRDYINRYYY